MAQGGKKRKVDAVDDGTTNRRSKRPAMAACGMPDPFGPGLFDSRTVKKYASEYATSVPYKHAVVSNLFDDSLLRLVRKEILENIHFTPKETDIYKIHQSGDLANLDGLDTDALKKLPSLLILRDALYSSDFRSWVSEVSGAGPVSGKKTDMAVNVYVPGCHLLCHDDVIGSRRVSYILYLTDPDKPWKADWGGALRLYPTDKVKGQDGKMFKIPHAEWSKVIPPAWNQLSFFAVQPGESFHDVEEVYHRGQNESEDHGGRFRMAISGWFHIPQEGEEGYEGGLEEKLAEKSSLQQLQGKSDELDEPARRWLDSPNELKINESGQDAEEDELSESELDFLLQYLTPNYLTPDTVEQLGELFAEESTLQLSNFLSPKFATRLREHMESADGNLSSQPFATSRPPYKHRYQYLFPDPVKQASNPYEQVLSDLLPSLAFRKWLSLATGLSLKRCTVLARRFRRGLDYQLAQGYEGEEPQLEYTLCVTPSAGWGADAEGANADLEGDGDVADTRNGTSTNTAEPAEGDEDNVGGYELYMAGDEADDEDAGSDDGVEIPANVSSHTGAGDRRSAKRRKADPAVYKAATDDDDDDGILFSNPASWNTLSIVLRDEGTLKFVKYVSQAAKGDRWDFTGCFEVDTEDDEDDDERDAAAGDG